MYHRPDLSPKQFGLKEGFVCALRDPFLKITTRYRTGKKVDKDWGTYMEYKDYSDVWRNRLNFFIDSQETRYPNHVEETASMNLEPSPFFHGDSSHLSKQQSNMNALSLETLYSESSVGEEMAWTHCGEVGRDMLQQLMEVYHSIDLHFNEDELVNSGEYPEDGVTYMENGGRESGNVASGSGVQDNENGAGRVVNSGGMEVDVDMVVDPMVEGGNEKDGEQVKHAVKVRRSRMLPSPILFSNLPRKCSISPYVLGSL